MAATQSNKPKPKQTSKNSNQTTIKTHNPQVTATKSPAHKQNLQHR